MSENAEGNNFESFGAWMNRQGLGDSAITSYQTYVSKCSECLSQPLDAIVRDEESMGNAIKQLAEKLSVADNSKSSYLSGLQKYYQFVHDGQKFRGRIASKCSHWYQEFVVDDIQDFFGFLRKLNSRQGVSPYDWQSWAFRGQGDALWGLESSLGRVADYDKIQLSTDVGRRLKLYEREALWSFRREISCHAEYHGFEGVDLLALMQHYECKTRLLDFTMTPLVALFMALAQNDQLYKNGVEYAKNHLGSKVRSSCVRPDFAVWAVDLNALCSIDKGSGSSQRTVEEIWAEADEIVRAHENEETSGVKVVFPSKCNKRISAQDGLFIMARNLAEGFERNLQAELGISDASDIVPMALSSIMGDECNELSPVCKFVISGSLREEVKMLLKEANVTAKTAFPDLIGLGRFVSSIIESHGEW